MRVLSGIELERLIATQESTFFDEAQIYVYSGYVDSYGDILKSWIPSEIVPCGFQEIGGNEQVKNEITIVGLDAIARFPLETEFTNLDKVNILKRNNVSVSGLFGIKNIKRGLTCLVLSLERLEV